MSTQVLAPFKSSPDEKGGHSGANRPLRVGVVYWQPGDGLARRRADKLKALGYEVIDFLYNARLPQHLDAVLAYGPLGSLAPLGRQLLACPLHQRPFFMLILTEQLPNPNLPEWVRYWLGRVRSKIERLAFKEQPEGVWQAASGWRWLISRAHRFRYYGDLFWLRQANALSVLAVWSRWTAGFLRARGFNPVVLTRGNNGAWGSNLNLERDIPVLWLGKIGTARRGRLLKQLRARLKERGIDLLVVDGVENPYVFGQERIVLLNRTKIVLNLLREKWDDNSLRYSLATHNGALIVSEPTLPHTDFIPGVHLVEAPIEQLADTICYYLAHDEERRQIVNQAQQLATQDNPDKIVEALESIAALQHGQHRICDEG